MTRPKMLEPERIQKSFDELKDQWTLDLSKKMIAISYQCKSFAHAMLFANAVAYLAEKYDYHPSITTAFKKIRCTLTTHDAGGLTEPDFKLAHEIETLDH